MIFEKIATLLADQLDVDPDDLTPETRIIEDLGADSLDVVELLMAAEDEFEVEIRKQVALAIDEADVILFVVDAREGLTPMDEDVAQCFANAPSLLCWPPTRWTIQPRWQALPNSIRSD